MVLSNGSCLLIRTYLGGIISRIGPNLAGEALALTGNASLFTPTLAIAGASGLTGERRYRDSHTCPCAEVVGWKRSQSLGILH